jgi:hypothetical protein
MKAIADGYNPGYLSLTGLLDDNELLNRVFDNQPHMGMSIKILHGLIHKEKNVFYSKLDIIDDNIPSFWSQRKNSDKCKGEPGCSRTNQVLEQARIASNFDNPPAASAGISAGPVFRLSAILPWQSRRFT